MTVSEAVSLLTRKALAVGFCVRRELSPVSDTVYVEVTAPTGEWMVRVRVSDHALPGRFRYPLEIRTTDPESAIDDVITSLTK